MVGWRLETRTGGRIARAMGRPVASVRTVTDADALCQWHESARPDTSRAAVRTCALRLASRHEISLESRNAADPSE